MGGKMNLNPLQKDDNTDALVKALEDANATDAAAQPAVPTDSSTIAADPQVASAGVMPAPDSSGVANAATVPDAAAQNTMSVDDAAAINNATSNLSLDGGAGTGSDLPSGISSDADAHLPTTAPSGEGTGDDSELDEVKNSALEQLRPLIEKLDLEPADKFDKYLMMLRASDDPALIKPAFDAAQGIPGEQEKAQALLDIINEINYITASKQQAPDTSGLPS